MEILLINSPVNRRNSHAGLTPPLGLAYIGAVLREAGYQVAAIDWNVTPMEDGAFVRYLQEHRPKMLGLSAYTETYNNAVAIARLAKQTLPELRTVIGGPHVSVLYEEAARAGVFDVVSLGEGEITNLELANLFLRGQGQLECIRGLAFLKEGQVVKTPDREPIADPDTLPFPARDLFPLERYRLPVGILTSRGGCPFACNFCAVNNIWQGKRRFRSPEKILEEIDHVVSTYRFDILNFSDDSFTLDKKRILTLCAGIKETYGPMVLNWQCATRVDLIDEELLRAMRTAGCNTIQFGIESGSQQILDAIGKKIRLDQARQAVSLSLKYGMETLCSFMFPHPEDTAETIEAQIGLMQEFYDQGAQLSLALTTPYPGTQFYTRREELGLTLLSENWDDYDCQHLLIATKHFGREALLEQLGKMVTSLGMRGSL